jgi:N-hydroxyarylamine O-acetyltransferase
MCNNPSSNTFRLSEYLERIGVRDAVRPDLPTLAALHAAHVDAIPFEDLDPFLGRPVKLDLDSLQQKLVRNHRGGYCFEQNSLLKAALEVIGFEVMALAARVRWRAPPQSALGPRSHMLLKVGLPEGSYLADVGFGSCLLDCPLVFKTDIEQRTPLGSFLLTEAEGRYSLHAKQPDGWRTAFVFDLEPQLPSDYQLSNWYASTCPELPFVSTLILERVAGDRRYKLVNQRLTIEARDGELAEERAIGSADDLDRVLEQTFRITPPAPVEEIFARLPGPDTG